MADRPNLHIAVAKQKNKASEYNENFSMMMSYTDATLLEAKDYVDAFMPSQSGNSGKFLKTNGTTANWFNLLGANNTFTGSNTFSGATTLSGNVTISGGTFSFPKCTTKPTTTSTASNTLPAVVIKNYLNGYSWALKWSDGRIEQGGRATLSGDNVTISLLSGFSYSDTKYSIILTPLYKQQPSVGVYAAAAYNPSDITTSSFKANFGSGSTGSYIYWRTSGY